MYHINCERHYSFSCICGPEKGRYVWHVDLDDLLRSGVLRDRFGTLAHSMLGQFSGQEKTDSCLYFTAADCRFLVVLRQARCFGGDSFEDVVDEAVHD